MQIEKNLRIYFLQVSGTLAYAEADRYAIQQIKAWFTELPMVQVALFWKTLA